MNQPLADRMRPTMFSDFVGQQHMVSANSLICRAVKANSLGSCIFFGPPGTGKTTLANIIANEMDGNFKRLNAVSSGVADAKKIIDEARSAKLLYDKQTFLLLDECHRWSKAQSDCVLSAIEDGSIIFIGSTTENPYTSMTRAIVSRCQVFELKHLTDADIILAMRRAVTDKEKGLGNLPLEVTEEAYAHLAFISGGDLRTALNALELAAKTTGLSQSGKIVIDQTVAEQCIQKKALSLSQDMYFDMLSAFCKSIRGSDADAALYWSERLILAEIDPLIIARRLIAHCSEDIGMADSNAILLATAAQNALQTMGPPEGLLPLSHAIIYACEAEKSNSVYLAMHAARSDAQSVRDDVVPFHLRNHPSLNDDKKAKYKYPHDFGGYCKQQYLPDSLKDRIYYQPSPNGREKNLVRKKKKEV